MKVIASPGLLVRAVVACAACVVLCAGCNLWRVAQPSDVRELVKKQETLPKEEPSLAEVERLLSCTNEVRRADGTTVKEPSEGWYLPLAQPAIAAEHRWRHAGLERWQALSESKRPDLAGGLKSADRGVAAAATIALARSQGERYAEAVFDVASDPLLSLATRRAAVETLSRGRSPQCRACVERLFTALSNEERSTYQPLLHVELLQGLGRESTPATNPRILAALANSNPEVSSAALEILTASATGEFPKEAVPLLTVVDTRVRVAALRTAAAFRAPAALQAALLAARDPDPTLRFAGIETLGALGGREATLELRELAHRDAELVQEAAILALGKAQDFDSVREFAGDKSWRVRRAVAAALAANSTAESAKVLRTLLADRSTEVQRRAVETVSLWPLNVSGPLLLTAIQSRHYAARLAAQEALAREWKPARSISAADLQQPAVLKVKLEELQAAWRAEFGASAGDLALEPAEPAADSSPTYNPATSRMAPGNAPQEFDVATLKDRLLDSNKHTRLSAAESLARQGYESGARALESLTFDLDPEIRRSTAAAIGSLEDPLFFAPLIRMLDDEPSIRLAALKALRQAAGRDIPQDTQPPPQNAAEEAQRWQAWYLRGGRD